MKNVKLTIEYDGTDYFGFQKQKHHVSIQSELEAALSAVCNHAVRITGSGRTDSGVHAKGHVVNFFTDADLTMRNIKRGANASLPSDIVVKSAQIVPSDFHARFSAKRKVYCYTVWNSETRSPLKMRYSYQYVFPLDAAAMKMAAYVLVGKHDFKAFGRHCDKKDNTVRTVYGIEIVKKGNTIVFRFEGDGFLYNMVRNMVGSLLLVGRGKLRVSDIELILASRERKKVGPTVPAHGLCLSKVIY